MKHPVFSFSALFIPFFIDFSHFSDQAAYFLLFIALFDFAVTFLLCYSFNVFFSLRHASLPLHLPGLPFSLFFACNFTFFPILNAFYSFSLLFSPLTAILQLLLPFRCFSRLFFLLFRPSLTAFASFQPFFSFSQLIFIFFSIFYLFRRFLPSFRHFSVFPPFFRFYLCHSSRLVFSRFTPLKMFHVKHRFSRFPVFSGQ